MPHPRIVRNPHTFSIVDVCRNVIYNHITHQYKPQAYKHPSHSTGIIHAIGRVLRLWINPLHMRAHAAVLTSRSVIIVLVMLTLTAIGGLRKVLGARVARDGVAGGSGDDVAVEEQVDRFKWDAWVGFVSLNCYRRGCRFVWRVG